MDIYQLNLLCYIDDFQSLSTIYRLFDILLLESRLLDSLNGLGIESSAHSNLLAMPVHGLGSNKVVVDIRSKAVVVSMLMYITIKILSYVLVVC